jgi:hypothetical protein
MMQWILIVVLALHLLSGIAWTGMTFGVARGLMPLEATPPLRASQRGAALLAMLMGLALWGLAHRGRFYAAETALAAGSALAILAGLLQGVANGRLKRAMAAGQLDQARAGVQRLDRVSAGLLVLTVALMAASKYL